MKTLIIIGVVVVVLIILALVIYWILKHPTHKSLEKLKQWLLYAVTIAEKELGGGTGQIKLRYVYDMFIGKFKFLAPFISFETFSKLVDQVLAQFRPLLESNPAINEYVNGNEDGK